MKSFLLLILSLLLLISCTEVTNPEDEDIDQTADWHASRVDAGLVNANSAFALDVLKELADSGNENTFYSPLSLSIALSMALNGAAGNTYDQMAEVLHFEGMELAEINQQNLHLVNSLIDADPTVEIGLSNSIWINEVYPVYDEFIFVNEEFYLSEVFPDQPFDATTVDAVNLWVENETSGLITDLLTELSPYDMMLLINTLYFNGGWTFAFDPGSTIIDNFYTGNDVVDADYLVCDGLDFTYYWEEEFSAVRLPYGDENFAMYIYLTNSDILSEWIERLEIDQFTGWFDEFVPIPPEEEDFFMGFKLPKFETGYSKVYNDILQELGMADAFSSLFADFSNQSDIGVFISMVQQDTWIKIDEAGTEAAASTVIVQANGILDSFFAVHPFLYLIRDERNGALLFMGIVNDPSQ